ncbi:MAG TPA: TonB family protein [Thermoanaerobaculia bacterium]|nr:TonB family protein [Thermoanaerobaculia bacterium]
MFETSVIHAQAPAARGRLSLLSASIMAHSAIVVGVLAMSIASVDFPTQSPNEYSRAPVFLPVRIPPPLGNPNGGAQPKPKETAAVKPAPLPTQPTAPAAIPDNITPVPSTGTSESSVVEAGSGPGTEPGPVGDPLGVKDSLGATNASPVPAGVPVAQPEEKIYQAHEVKAPVLLSRAEPRYPQSLIRSAMPGTVVVRCIIDKNGNIRDPEIVMATMPPFGAEVLRVLHQWKYKPATYAGRPVDSYLNLTVSFQVRR